MPTSENNAITGTTCSARKRNRLACSSDPRSSCSCASIAARCSGVSGARRACRIALRPDSAIRSQGSLPLTSGTARLAASVPPSITTLAGTTAKSRRYRKSRVRKLRRFTTTPYAGSRGQFHSATPASIYGADQRGESFGRLRRPSIKNGGSDMDDTDRTETAAADSAGFVSFVSSVSNRLPLIPRVWPLQRSCLARQLADLRQHEP